MIRHRNKVRFKSKFELKRMSKVKKLNTELEQLNSRLSQLESELAHIDLNRVLQLKDHTIDRVVNRVVKIGNDRKAREREKDAIEKFFSNVSPSSLLRLQAKSFGHKLLFGSKYVIAKHMRRNFDTRQSIEKFFITKQKINSDNIEKQRLQRKLEEVKQIGYGGFLSSKPSKREYEQQISEINAGLSNLSHDVSQSFIRDEEFLLSLCKISHKNYDEVRAIDARITSIKKELNEIKKQESYDLKMAKAAAFDDEARQQARGLKSKIIKQEYCPYCSKKIIGKSHLDHIHPLSKGGLNVAENVVDCCASCNLKKSDKGVFQFCKEQGFNYEKVCNRLLLLGKHI